ARRAAAVGEPRARDARCPDRGDPDAGDDPDACAGADRDADGAARRCGRRRRYRARAPARRAAGAAACRLGRGRSDAAPVSLGSRGFRPHRPGMTSGGGWGHQVNSGITDLMTSLAVIFVLLLVVFASAPRAAAPALTAPPEPPRARPAPEAFTDLTRLGLMLQ